MSESFESILRAAVSQGGRSLYDISFESQVLVTFLRHFGCVFCQEQVAELARIRRALEVGGVRLAFVHMEPEDQAQVFFERYGLADVHRYYDPDRTLYEAFELHRASGAQLWGLPVILRAAKLVLTGKAEFAKPTADTKQMPGLFLMYQGSIERAFRPQRISEKPDYVQLADCTICDIDFSKDPA